MNKVTYVDNVTVIGASNLNEIQDEIERLDTEKSDLDSPTFTGTPTAPTPTEGDSSTKIATTEFVEKKTDSTYITGTASGEIASFSDGADGIPVQSLTASINAVQNLNGYSKPWVGGSGKNKLQINESGSSSTSGGTFTRDQAAGTIACTGTITRESNTIATVASQKNYPSGTYIFSQGGSHPNLTIRLFDVTANAYLSTTDAETTVTIDETHLIAVRIYIPTGTYNASVVFKPMLRLSTVSDSTFEPYENICPISGYSSVNVVDCGKNLADFKDGYNINTQGQIVTNADRIATVDPIVIKPNVQYKILALSDESSIRFICCVWNGDTIVRRTANIYNGGTLDVSGGTHFYVCAYSGSVSLTVASTKAMVILSTETDTSYEPYTGTTTTISLGSTCYGGTLDVTSGVLTVNKGYVDLGTLDWAYNGSAFDSMREFSVVLTGKANGILNMMCSALTVASASGASGYKCIRGRATSATISVVWDDMTVANFKSAMSGYQLVYDLATPTAVTLTPTQVATVLGQNNLWADSGTVEVVYRADTQMKIAETSWNFLGTCLSGTTVTLTLPNDWTGIVRIWYPYQTTALRYYEIYAICDSNGAVHQFAVSNTSTITLTQAQNTLTIATSSSSSPNTYYFTCEGSGKITATGLE